MSCIVLLYDVDWCWRSESTIFQEKRESEPQGKLHNILVLGVAKPFTNFYSGKEFDINMQPCSINENGKRSDSFLH